MADTAAQDRESQTGLPADEPVGPHPLTRRQAAMDAIDVSRRAMLRENEVDLPEEPEQQSPAPLEPGTIPVPEDQETPAPLEEPEPETPLAEPEAPQEPGEQTEEPKEPAEEAEPTHKVLVNGEEREVPVSQLVEAYQIGEATRSKLDVASRVLEQVEELQGRLARGEKVSADAATMPTGDGQKTTPEAPGDQAGDPVSEIDWSELTKSLQFESHEEAGQKLENAVRKLVAGGGQQDSAALDTMRLQILEQIEWNEAMKTFGNDYQDILTDQYLAQVTGTLSRQVIDYQLREAQRLGQSRPTYHAMLSAAGDEVRNWWQGRPSNEDSPEPAPNGESPRTSTSVTAMSDRTERKRASPQPPSPRAAAPKPAQQAPPKEESEIERRRDAIRDIAKARGQTL